ncbi:efflux RND transporter permease subunit [Tahibacter amnicola]|uniref:Efflux RND transporter permease subunit n=1 Tax=Tahibacter amnicola TaxID=2976241 RepID=A0ABY6BAL0_9GAMM|nr:efflux RND transporter permease subunit [Tahibacter amnicola]UXI66899.1 efflux RND transporter permease subunit [Tahibacter amnicola]
MNFSAWAIRRPLPSVLLFLLLCGAGFIGFRALPISKFPDISLPMVTVTVNLPGAAPSQMETEVTRKIEDAVASLADIDKLVSTVNEGVSTTRVEFELGRDLDEALDEVRDAVTRTRPDLPTDIEEPIVSKVNMAGGTLLSFAVESDKHTVDELSWLVDDAITKALFGVPGVGQVTRTGGVDREVRIDLRPGALEAHGITAGAVSQQLARIQVERPGGKATWGGAEQVVRTVGTVRDAAALREFPIALPDGRQVRLSALADIRDGVAEPRQTALLNGKPVVSFAVSRTRGSSEVGVGAGVHERVAALAREYPSLRFTEVNSTVEEAENSYSSSMTMLWEGSLLAVIVVWLFLRDWRATWISALALPLSIIPTFAVMHWLDFSLNIVTLLALAVVVGILVDDAIVEVENIVRHLAMGKKPRQAAEDAADEIGLAVIATSLTLAAVFVPVAFMPGIPGKFFREFGWTAATAVMFSLMVARLLTPMMAAYQLKPHAEAEGDSRLMRGYLRLVEAALRHRGRTLWLALGIFIASLAIVPMIPATFIPPADPGRSNVNLELPPGATLAETTAVAEAARAKLHGIPELKLVYTAVGGVLDMGDPSQSLVGDARKAILTLDWGKATDRKRSQKVLEREVRARLADLPGVRMNFLSSEPGELLQLVLAGDDPRVLAEASQAFERDLRTLKGIGSVSSTASLLRPEIIITPDPGRAADLGVATADIAEAARIATSGDFRQRLAKLNLPERQIPIRVSFANADLDQPALFSLLRVPGREGPVPLASVATIRLDSGPAQIDRFGRQRNITLTMELNGRPLGDVMAEIDQLPSKKALPPGVKVLNTGDSEIFVELFLGFLMAMGTGIFCVYAVLLLLFNNALQPITILVAVPLCAGGAFGMLLLTNNYLSLPALIGLLMLIGIATKNSILLVDYAVIAEQDMGMSQHDALVDACRKRARPVLMTTLAMGAGMLPIAMGFGADASFRAPMAIAVIGGLMTSTLLSLVVIPAAYAVLDDVREWVKHRVAHRGNPAALPEQ